MAKATSRKKRLGRHGTYSTALAFAVGIADEIHRSRIAGREASITDLLLDRRDVVVACLILGWFHKRKISGPGSLRSG